MLTLPTVNNVKCVRVVTISSIIGRYGTTAASPEINIYIYKSEITRARTYDAYPLLT